ncbi:methyl-accepting chemotaxis protein [Novosphingobium sp.]|uniref:methyl-accepting chemotaxis protein n=1 Tax=Novosphingobium sp. TaxID=1874826 RepID=UPI0035669202
MLKWFETVAPIRQKFSFLLKALVFAASLNFVGIALAQVFPETGLAISLGFAALSALLIITIITMASERICTPYVNTVVRMEALAAGDTRSPIQYTQHADCVGRMTKAMAKFGENIEKTTDLDTQQRIIAKMNHALSRLAENDLTAEIREPFPGAYEDLRINFNRGLATVSSTMSKIRELAENVLRGSDEINAASADLAQRNERQAANLQVASNAMGGVTAALTNTAAQAHDANKSVASAVGRAQEGQDIAASATTSMQEIERSSGEISRIVSLIDGIAFQTNLLALNAGVEAARAGEAGKGFAVVATEVRALAQRCTDAARDIKTLVTASSATVSQGVNTVERTREVLVELSTRISEINTFISDVANKTGEQVSQLRDVTATVAEMDQMTQQNAAMVEESAAAARSLAQQANTLSASVGAFRIGDNVRQFTQHAAPAPAPAPAPAAVYTPAPRQAPVAARAPVAYGNLAVASDDWDEF